jgi:hypothetical protein
MDATLGDPGFKMSTSGTFWRKKMQNVLLNFAFDMDANNKNHQVSIAKKNLNPY